MNAIYGDLGIKHGYLEGLSLEYVSVCDELMQKGCELILPSITEISLITEQLWKRDFQ
jgi:aspartate racemase